MLTEEYIKKFNINGKLIKLEQITDGNINNTYIATFEIKNCTKRYLIQQINNYVFKNPYEVMENIANVTSFINNKLKKENDTIHSCLNVIKTMDNKDLLVIKNNSGEAEFYRAYDFIENAICFNSSNNLEIIKNTGKAFGNFQKMLNDYPIENLHETIKDFHNTKCVFEKFKKDIELDEFNLVSSVKNEINYLLSKEKESTIICNKLKTKEIPLRVTHNDTKVNNVMMNKETFDYITVIDLDTVMPGSMLYDYADGIRSTASSVTEDEKDLSKIYLKNEFFEAYTDGFLNEMAPFITKEELKLMSKSILIITIELAIRFLDDYITGNKYFKCKYKEHNLVRARNQICLAKDIETKLKYIDIYILKSYNKNIF